MSTSDKIKDVAVSIFMASVGLLTFIALMAIWDIFDGEVVYKSFTTIGIIGFAAVVVVIAANYMDHRTGDTTPPMQ